MVWGKIVPRGPLIYWLMPWLVGFGILIPSGSLRAQSAAEPPSLPALEPPGPETTTSAASPRPDRPEDLAKPITIQGDQSWGWSDEEHHVLLVRGKVVIEQGLNRLRMNEALIWISKQEPKPGQVVPAQIYGEGEVTFEEGTERKRYAKIFLVWRTTGELRLKNTQQSLGQAAADDPFYRRAVAEQQLFLHNGSVNQPLPETPKQQESDLPKQGPTPLLSTNRSPAKLMQRPDGQGGPGPEGTGQEPGPSLGFGQLQGKRIQIAPRGTRSPAAKIVPTGPNEQAVIVTDGVAIYVTDDAAGQLIDISTDRAIIWLKDLDLSRGLAELRGGISRDQAEIYLEGHVEIRQATLKGDQAGTSILMIADNAYYDVGRNVATMRDSEVIVRRPGLPLPVYLQSSEIRQVSLNRFEASDAVLFASRLPSDPDFKVFAREISLETRQVERRGLFGITMANPETGQPEMVTELFATATEVVPRLREFPIGYIPYAEGDLREPLGPLRDIRVRTDRVFGFGLLVGWDMFSLLGMHDQPNTRWRLETDYLSKRGPALGTEFLTTGVGLFGIGGRYDSSVLGYIIYDQGTDILGGPRTFEPPRELRGRIIARHRQELNENWSLMAQGAYLSDRNFLEQYYKREFDEELNQETYLRLQFLHSNFGFTAEAQPNLRSWVNETQKLPEGKGYLIGQDLLQLFNYNARASAGYLSFHRTRDVPFAYLGPVPNEFDRYRPLPPSIDTPNHDDLSLGRFDLWQELELPFNLGPMRVSPYGRLDLAYYTDSLVDDALGRVAGGGGARASLPLTKIDLDAYSQLLNVNGLAHKVTFEADYRYIVSNQDFRKLPGLDRLDDDATDQARRDLRLYRLGFPGPFYTAQQLGGINLATNPLYDPQLFALRRGLDWNTELIDDMQFLRFGVRQRWQTKRGFPGQEHIVDWITFNMEATYFPDNDRDNYGHPFGLLGYDFTWHLGDRTTLVSHGFAEPFGGGGKYFNVGWFIDRTERLNFYLGFRHIDPLGVDAVVASTSYAFSSKYQVTWATSYDFGNNQNLGNSIILTRVGTDLQLSIGVTYDALRNNLGVNFEIIPILAAPKNGRRGGLINQSMLFQ